MDHLSKIPDSESENEDQRKYGFFKRDGKYFVNEYRKEDMVTKVLSNFIMQSLFHLINGSNNSKRILVIQRNTGEISIIEVFSSTIAMFF